MGYFERPVVFAILVAAFALVFVPLTALSLIPNYIEWLPYAVLAVGVGLGVSHFFITLALYGQSRNLDYFASSTRNKLIYFGFPALALVSLALFGAFRVEARYPLIAFYVFGAIRLADFYHVGRQSFGMLQIWRRPLGDALPRWQRSAENVFFVGMALLQWRTYLGGGYMGEDISATLPATLLGAVFVAVAVSYMRAADLGAGRRALIPLSYFAMQAISAAVAVYETRLYLVALTLHYIEYHLIMMPRCFYAPLDPQRRVDRVSRVMRANAILFYALLLGVVLVFEGRNHVPAGLSTSTLFFVHIFDGIFLVHYFVEAFLWRFGNPFYRQSLGPLYFRPWAEAKLDAERSGDAPRLGRSSALGLGGALAAGLLALSLGGGGLSSAAAQIKRRVGDPMHAQLHVEWGVALSHRGDFANARRHFEEAIARAPDNAKARSFLAQLDAFLEKQRAASAQRGGER